MSEQVLEKLISSYLSIGLTISSFAWQGGEPTLMGLDFYRKVIELQQRYGRNAQMVSNTLQTNGLLLDEQWCRFLSEWKFLVGVSLDGPQKYHDHYRRDHAGCGTFEKVIAAIEKCHEHKVEFNVLVLLNNVNVTAADELFDFFVEQQIRYLQFVPCVEKGSVSSQIAEYSISPRQYGDFLCRLFDRWLVHGPHRLSIRMFDSLLLYCLGQPHSLCTFSHRCGDYVVVEHNGDVFCCDFFVERDWRLGNILESPIEELVSGPRKREFARKKSQIGYECLVCRYLDVCRGGCLKDRVVVDGRYDRPSYFCESYKQFFDYALGRFWDLAARFKQARAQPC
jgi:uncharacterized protein